MNHIFSACHAWFIRTHASDLSRILILLYLWRLFTKASWSLRFYTESFALSWDPFLVLNHSKRIHRVIFQGKSFSHHPKAICIIGKLLFALYDSTFNNNSRNVIRVGHILLKTIPTKLLKPDHRDILREVSTILWLRNAFWGTLIWLDFHRQVIA